MLYEYLCIIHFTNRITFFFVWFYYVLVSITFPSPLQILQYGHSWGGGIVKALTVLNPFKVTENILLRPTALMNASMLMVKCIFLPVCLTGRCLHILRVDHLLFLYWNWAKGKVKRHFLHFVKIVLHFNTKINDL